MNPFKWLAKTLKPKTPDYIDEMEHLALMSEGGFEPVRRRPDRPKTKAPYNFQRVKARRKMAAASRKINRR